MGIKYCHNRVNTGLSSEPAQCGAVTVLACIHIRHIVMVLLSNKTDLSPKLVVGEQLVFILSHITPTLLYSDQPAQDLLVRIISMLRLRQ